MTKYCVHPESYECIYCQFSKAGAPIAKLEDLAHSFYQQNKRSYSGKGCDSCQGVDEPYMLTDLVWKKANKKSKGFLCLSCVEKKIGRDLRIKDFTNAPINYGIFGFDCRTYVRK